MGIKILFLFQVLVIVSLYVSAATFFVEPDYERLALMDLKNRVTEDPFGVTQGWNDSENHCNWTGITCNSSSGKVTIINLQDQKLSGSLSPSIGNLSFLTGINIQNNTFNGELPQELGRLGRLRHINMTWNEITGSIPTNISQCRSLEVLNVGYNFLSGKIPDELNSLSSLRVFGVGANNLTGTIPPWIGNLSSLTKVTLGLNRFSGRIPNEFGQLSKLQVFQLYGNEFSGVVPPSVYNISNLYFFSVTQNQLHGEIPADVGIKLPNLQIFAGGVNSFTGSIPASLSNCTNLQVLDFAQNALTGGVPTTFGILNSLRWLNFDDNILGNGNRRGVDFVAPLSNCTVLEKLSFNRNLLGGEFPIAVANLSAQLTVLGLSQNLLHGSMSTGIGNLVSLANLALEGNLLTGPIPYSFGKLKQLTEVRLQFNKLSGPIPPSIGNLTSLIKLFMENNKLEGHLPVALGSCQKLLNLNLSSNNFRGAIPKEVLSISSLSIALSLSNNFLSGQIPAEVYNLRNLVELDLADNELSGEIPSSLGDCVVLQRLLLQSNSLQGTIPKTLASLPALLDVDLSSNNLSGPIARSFSSLKNLNLSYNDFEGEVQQIGVFANASAFSVLGNNRLCGGIPKLLLPPCPESTTSSRRSLMKKVVLIVLPVIASLILVLVLCSCVACCFLKRRKRPLEAPSTTETQRSISYLELYKATNRFSNGNLIGAGSFGSVYKGLLPDNNLVVAVKVLNLEQKGAPGSFLNECMALKNIRHRNLLKIITLCSSIDRDGKDFKSLVFEYMSNGNLDQWLHPCADENGEIRRTLSFAQRLDIAIDVAAALNYLHYSCQPPIAHCDLKPSNTLIDDDMAAHVGDFGLAQLLMEESVKSQGATLTVGLKGSIGYIPPEYGMGGEPSILGDVYSYGILLLEMFTGKRPTDEMFEDGLSIHDFVAKALPDNIMSVVDSWLNLDEEEQQGNDVLDDQYEGHGSIKLDSDTSSEACMWSNGTKEKLTVEKYLLAIFSIGLSCSELVARNRMAMNLVEKKLRAVREAYARAHK